MRSQETSAELGSEAAAEEEGASAAGAEARVGGELGELDGGGGEQGAERGGERGQQRCGGREGRDGEGGRLQLWFDNYYLFQRLWLITIILLLQFYILLEHASMYCLHLEILYIVGAYFIHCWNAILYIVRAYFSTLY
jgi:hypothetical protein